MTERVVALLRGINVGRAKPVDMGRLRQLLAGLGYADVATYLRSGNAVFSCPQSASTAAAVDIEHAVVAEFGFESRVIVRTQDQVAAAMSNDPLPTAGVDGARHFVGFLAEDPDAAGVRLLEATDYGSEQFRVVGRHFYLWCPDGLTGGQLGKVNFDRALGSVATVRNWNTVVKLSQLLGG